MSDASVAAARFGAGGDLKDEYHAVVIQALCSGRQDTSRLDALFPGVEFSSEPLPRQRRPWWWLLRHPRKPWIPEVWGIIRLRFPDGSQIEQRIRL